MRGCTGTFAPRAPVIRLAASGENFGGNQQVTSAARAGATVETEVATMTHSFINRERLFTWESPGARRPRFARRPMPHQARPVPGRTRAQTWRRVWISSAEARGVSGTQGRA